MLEGRQVEGRLNGRLKGLLDVVEGWVGKHFVDWIMGGI